MKKVFYSLMVAAGLVALTPVVLAASGSSGDGDVNIEAEGEETPADPEEDGDDAPIDAADNYAVVKSWNFADTLAFGDNEYFDYLPETVSLAGTASNLGQGKFEGLAAQGADRFFVRRVTGGLYSNNGGGRKFGVLDLQATNIVKFTMNAGGCLDLATTDIAELVSEEETEAGYIYTYKMKAAGNFAVTMTRYFTIYNIEVLAQTRKAIALEWNFADTLAFGDNEYFDFLPETVSLAGTASNLGKGKFEGLAAQGADRFFVRRATGGLYSNNGGGRKFGVLDLKAGDEVVFTMNAGGCLDLATTDIAELVSEEETEAGYVYTYKMKAAGNFAVTMTRYFTIYKITVTRTFELEFGGYNFTDTLLFADNEYFDYLPETVSLAGTASNLGQGKFEGLAAQGADRFFVRRATNGLYSNNGGGRKFGVLDRKAGDVISFTMNAGGCLDLATTDIAELVSEEETEAGYVYTYNMKAAGNFAVTMTRYYTIHKIDIEGLKSDLEKAVIKAEDHNDWEPAVVGITSKTKNAQIFFKVEGPDTLTYGTEYQAYTEPFTMEYSGTVYAYTMSADGKSTTKEQSAAIVAGFVAVPTATITKVYDEKRYVTLATAAGDLAEITYSIDGGKTNLPYTEPVEIAETTVFNATAQVGKYLSETMTAEVAAGTMVQLNAPVFTVHQIEDSAKAVYFAEHNLVAYDVIANQGSVLCDPTASTTIDAYYVTPDYKDTIVLGTFATPAVIDSIPYGGVFAVAKAEGYATSAESHVYNKPALELTPVWEINFQDSIFKMAEGAYYSSIGELVQGAVVTNLSNTDYVALTLKGTYKEVTVTGTDTTTTEIAFESPLDDRFAIQSGTSWLLRSMIDGRVDYTGLYQYNGGWRSIALRNLKKRQVVKIVTAGGYDGSAFDAYGTVDETQGNMASMLELNVGESSSSQLVYTVKAEGDVNLYIHRYAYINQIGVYESNANVADPKFSIASVDENGTNVEIATETPDAFVFYRRAAQGQLPDGIDIDDVMSSTKILDPDPTHTHMEMHYLPQDSVFVNGMWEYSNWQVVEVEMRDSIYVGEYWLPWTKYTGLVSIQDSAVFEAYAWYQDVESDIVRDTIYANYDLALAQPVIESVVNGVVTISADNSGLDLSVNVAKPTSTIWYQLPGGEPAIYGAPIELPAGTYGWMQAWAEAPGFETSTKAWRYLDGREAYNETYAWVVAETKAVPAAVTGDLELANVHELNAATTAVTPAGHIYLHKKVTKNFNSLVLPFAYNNTTTVTDAKGNVLERGVDFKIFNMTTAGSGNRTNDTSMETLLDALDEERTGNLTANTGAYLLQILNSDLVGEDIIFVSAAGVSLSARNAPSYTEREEGWQIVVNNTLEPQTVGVKAYHLNETGTAYVLDENFVAAPLTTVIITEAAFAAANPEIVLIEPEPTYLEIAETLVFIPTEDAVADAVAAGWMEHGGTFTNNKTLTVNPETEEDEQTKSAPGLGIKAGNPAKSAAFYVTGADEVRSFATSTGSADRTMVVTATPNDGTDAVTAQATTSTTTAIIPLALDAAKCYKIEFASYDESGAGADMVIHAVKFVKIATGIDAVVIENTDTDVVYDLTGRRVDTLVKGQIYIQNGKRFMVK